MFTEQFSRYACQGDKITCEIDGFTATATIYHDDTQEAPWVREDGHGPVSDWRRDNYHGRPSKAPGERVLNRDHSSARFYDMAEAVKIARRDGWGVEGGRKEGETAGAYAARAAEADFQRLRAWCNDEWAYVGVAVTVEKDGIELTGKYDAALWGIESDAGAYLTEVANELLPEALEMARAAIARLTKSEG